MLLVDEGREKLKKVVEKKKKLKISSLGDNYDSDKFVKSFIQGIKDKIEGKSPLNPFQTPDKNGLGNGSGSGTSSGTTPLDPFQTGQNASPD